MLIMSAAFTSVITLRYQCFRQLNRMSKSCKRVPGFSPPRRHRLCVKALADKPEDPLQRISRIIAESYQDLEPGQQLYLQVLYITLVVTIMLSVSATLVRIYNTFRMAGPSGW